MAEPAAALLPPSTPVAALWKHDLHFQICLLEPSLRPGPLHEQRHGARLSINQQQFIPLNQRFEWGAAATTGPSAAKWRSCAVTVQVPRGHHSHTKAEVHGRRNGVGFCPKGKNHGVGRSRPTLYRVSSTRCRCTAGARQPEVHGRCTASGVPTAIFSPTMYKSVCKEWCPRASNRELGTLALR